MVQSARIRQQASACAAGSDAAVETGAVLVTLLCRPGEQALMYGIAVHCCCWQVTALQIAALKKIGRGSKVLLLDRFGTTSKAVAKELSRRGFGRVYVVAGGWR